MNPLSLVSPRVEGLVELRSLLLSLARYGRPRVLLMDRGWHCAIEMNTNMTGTSFDVRNDFNHADPLTAAVECTNRVAATLKALGKEPTP